MLIVLDAVEAFTTSDTTAVNEIARAIAKNSEKLPWWVKVLMFSRPDQSIAREVKGAGAGSIVQFELNPQDDHNKKDLRRFLAERVRPFYDAQLR